MDSKINKLNQIGLPNREAEIYLALLQKYEFTAPELTKLTNVTRSKIYELLQNLIHKGACSESYKDGQKVYRAIEPKLAIQNIISKRENELEKEIAQMKEAGISIETELVTLHENGADIDEPLNYIEVLTDKEQIKEKWLNIQNNTKKELLVFSKPPYSGNLIDNVEDETDIIKNNVIVRGIYEYKDLDSEEISNLIKMIEIFQKIGEEARVIKELPMKLVISDDSYTMLALNDKITLKQSITSMVVNHPVYAMAHKEVFEVYWAKSITVEEFKRDLNKYTNSNTNE